MKNLKLIFAFILFSTSCSLLSGQSIQKVSDGIVFKPQSGTSGKIKIKVWSENTIQVILNPTGEFSTRESLIITEKPFQIPDWKVFETDKQVEISTNSITARIDKLTSKLDFIDKSGNLILAENGREIKSAKVVGEDCFHIKQSFQYSQGETLYGLGSFQDADQALNGSFMKMFGNKNHRRIIKLNISIKMKANGYLYKIV